MGGMLLGQDAAGAGGCRGRRLLDRAHSAEPGSSCIQQPHAPHAPDYIGLDREKGFANSRVTRARHMN